MDYHFKSDVEFDELLEDGDLLEWAEVHGKRYGTLASQVRSVLAKGNDLILEIDPQGNDQIRNRISNTFSIFVAPPSFSELKKRLENRATESVELIEARMRTAEVEMLAQKHYNVTVVNDDLESAQQEIIEIIDGHRAQRFGRDA